MEGTKQATTVIGRGTHISGEMVFDNDAVILGSFEGRVSTTGVIQIGEGAVCKAAVAGATVVIDGLVEGDVRGTERVDLSPTAQVVGDIVAAVLVVAEGASINGHCRIGRGEIERTAPGASPDGGASSRISDSSASRARVHGGDTGSPRAEVRTSAEARRPLDAARVNGTERVSR